MINILDSTMKRKAIIQKAEKPWRFEEINGENTLSFDTVLDYKTAAYIDENHVVELDEDYFDIVFYEKKQNEDGTLTVQVETEHVSYRLNDSEYNVETFTSTGTPAEILTDILFGTGFSVGTIELTETLTYSAQEAKSRRQLLMEFVSYLGGEIDFNKFEISILQHRGSTSLKILTKGKNIKVVSKIYNGREKNTEGNALVSYTCTPIQLPDKPFTLGDNTLLIQKDLGIQENLRIIRYGYNPYDNLEYKVELANFINGLEDDFYCIETTKLVKEKVYNGVKIGPEEGIVCERSDGKVRNVSNATEGISISSDTGNGLEKNFYVDINGRIKGKQIDIDESGTFGGELKVLKGESPNEKIIMLVYKDTAGGVIKVYDINGNLNAKIGVESGVSSNTGGTLVLYKDVPDGENPVNYQRVEMGTISDTDSGAINLRDTNNKVRANVYANSPIGPYMGIRDPQEELKTYMSETDIYMNTKLVATEDSVALNYEPKITGANGTFTTLDGKTVTVDNGKITSIA